MSREIYKYSFNEATDLDEAEASLVLAFFGAEALHGEAQVQLDASHAFDRELRTCVIDAGTVVGRDLNRLFMGYLRHEFGSGQFTVKRLERHATPDLTPAAA